MRAASLRDVNATEQDRPYLGFAFTLHIVFLLTSFIVTGLSTILRMIWFASGILQIAILILIVSRRHYRTLPMFAWYIGLNFAQALILIPVYSHFGFISEASFRIYWATEVITMIAQTLASTELLHRALQDYPGIWELAWRLILSAIVVVIVYSWITANKNDQWGLMYADRGYYLTFAVAFVLCLLLVRHYSVAMDPVYKVLLGGFCFYSCGAFVSDTLLKAQFMQHLPKYSDVWNESELLIFFVVLVVWIVALRHPVSVPVKTSSGIGAGAYEQIGPQVNARLRELNDTLRKFFRKQAAES
jgi:hypothetical protein